MSEAHEFPDADAAEAPSPSQGEAAFPDPPAAEAPWPQRRAAILDRFAAWLDTAAETEAGREQLRRLDSDPNAVLESAPAATAGDTAPLAGLLEVVGSLTALRHEMKLQTKSNRVLAERLDTEAARFENSAEQIARTLERFPDIDARQIARPLADSLADMDEAVGRLREAIDALADDWPATPPPPPTVSWWGRGAVAAAWHTLTDTWKERHRRLSGLAEGVRLLSRRLEGHLADHHIERIGRVGEAVDPHAMQVLEVTTDSTAAAGTVVKVLRPGYRRGQIVLRPAQVAAAAGP